MSVWRPGTSLVSNMNRPLGLIAGLPTPSEVAPYEIARGSVQRPATAEDAKILCPPDRLELKTSVPPRLPVTKNSAESELSGGPGLTGSFQPEEALSTYQVSKLPVAEGDVGRLEVK